MQEFECAVGVLSPSCPELLSHLAHQAFTLASASASTRNRSTDRAAPQTEACVSEAPSLLAVEKTKVDQTPEQCCGLTRQALSA